MERKSSGFSQPKFMTRKSSPEANSSTSSPTTPAANPLPRKPSLSQHSVTIEPSRPCETSELVFHGPQTGSRLPSFFSRSPTNRPSRFFSPASKTAHESSFATPYKKSMSSPDDETRSPITSAASPLPCAPSHPTSYVSSGEVQELVIHRPRIIPGPPSFFQRPFSSVASEFSFTPRKKQIVAEISSESPSSDSSPTVRAGSNVRPFSTPSRFQANRFLQITNIKAEELQTETPEPRFENESKAAEDVNESEHSAFYQSQLNETVESERQYFDEGERKMNSHWTNGSSPDQEEISFEKQVHSITEQLLAAAANTQSNIKGENTSLKKELNRSQMKILNLEAQFDELKKQQSEAIERANDLSVEKETLRNHLRNLQEQVCALEKQLEQKQGQCEEVNSQLDEKEQRLKAALTHISTLEELLRSSDERLSDLQTQLQLVLTEREAADEKVNALSRQVDCLQQNLSSLELTMSNAENNFHSVLDDYRNQQENLEKELANYQKTEFALKNACTDFESIKEELGTCTNELIKVQTDSKAIAKEKLELEDNFALLNEKYSICERSFCAALENISSLESTRNTLQAEIQQLKHQLETSSTELFATGEKVTTIREENEVLHSQLDSLREKMNDSEEKYRLDLTKIQQELDCERAGHTETKMSAVRKLSDTKNALELQVNGLQENVVVIERQKESIKQELESERTAHSETKSHLKVCKSQLEEDRNEHLLESSKVQETVNILKDEKEALKFEIIEIQGNMVVAFSQKESIKKELDDEKTAHSETKSHLKDCKDRLENDRNQHSVQLFNIQSVMQILSDQNKFLEAQVSELKEKVDEAERQNESIKQELCCERKAHQETKSNWKDSQNRLEDDQNEQSLEISELQSAVQVMDEQRKFMEAQVNDLQCKLVAAGQKHEAIREQHLSLERQLEFSAIEISTLRVEAQEQSNRNNNLQALLDDIQMKSALSEDNLKAALSKSHKELDSQRGIHQETIRNLTEARLQLLSSESTCSETLSDRTKLQSDITNLLNEKQQIEELVQRLQRTISAQEQNIDTVTKDNLKLMKDNMEIKETFELLEKQSFQARNIVALIADSKIIHQKCQLVFTENSGALTNANLTTEIRTLNEKFEIVRKKAEVVDEDLTDLIVSIQKLIENNTAFFMEIRERLEETQLCLVSSNESLQRATIEKSSLENEICELRTEKKEWEKKIETFAENSITSESIREKLRNTNAVLESMKSSASQQILDLQKRVQSADAELILSNVKSKELANEKTNLENQLGSLRRQLQESQDKSENAMRMHIAEKEELEKKIEAFIETTAYWESVSNRNSALNSSMASSSQQISDLQQRVHTLEKEQDLSNEKVSDLIVHKTNLESQLGSLRHQLQACQDKSNRDLEKLRNQLETERASHEDYKSRLAIIHTSSDESKGLTNEAKKGCSKVVSKVSKTFVNDNKNSNTQRNEMPSSAITNEEFQRRPLRDCRQQLETGKTSHKNQSNNLESPSQELNVENRPKDNVNVSSMIKEEDKRDSKKFQKNVENIEEPVEIIEESPPSATRKAPSRRAAVAAKHSLSLQIKSENSPSTSDSTSSSKEQATPISDEGQTIRGRKRLVLAPSPSYPFPTPSPVSVDPKRVQKNPTSPKAIAVIERVKSPQFNANDSFIETPLPPTKKTYARKRLSMTARLNETNPSSLSAQQASKKTRRTFK